MKTIICILLSFLALTVSFDADAQLPPEMRAKYTDEEYAAIMSRYHFHFRYELYGPVDKPVKRGQVKLGQDYYDRWQGPSGWYYCSVRDGECFDNRGFGVDPTGSCWVDKAHQCTDNPKKRDVSYFAKYFRVRGDLGPPMTLKGQLPQQGATTASMPSGLLPVWLEVLTIVSPMSCLGLFIF